MKVTAERLKKNYAKRREAKKEGLRAAYQHMAENYYRTAKSAYKAKTASQKYY